MKLTYALGLSACVVAYAVPIDKWHHKEPPSKRDSPATDDSTNTLTVDTKPLIAGDDATYRLPLSELGKLGIIEVKPGSNIFGNRKPGITVDDDNTNPLNSGEDPLIAADGTNKPLADGLPDADKLKSIIDDTTKPPSKRDDPLTTDDNAKSEDEDPLNPKNPIPLEDVLDNDDEDDSSSDVHFGEGFPRPRIGVPVNPPAKRDDPLTTTTVDVDTLKAGGDPLIAADGTNQKLPDGDDDELRKLGIIAVPDEPKDKGDDDDEGDENDPFHGFPHDFVLENKRPPIDTFPYSDQPVSNN